MSEYARGFYEFVELVIRPSSAPQIDSLALTAWLRCLPSVELTEKSSRSPLTTSGPCVRAASQYCNFGSFVELAPERIEVPSATQEVRSERAEEASSGRYPAVALRRRIFELKSVGIQE